jgi:hypothetical protein
MAEPAWHAGCCNARLVEINVTSRLETRPAAEEKTSIFVKRVHGGAIACRGIRP